MATMRGVKKSPHDFALFVWSFASDKRPIARTQASNSAGGDVPKRPSERARWPNDARKNSKIIVIWRQGQVQGTHYEGGVANIKQSITFRGSQNALIHEALRTKNVHRVPPRSGPPEAGRRCAVALNALLAVEAGLRPRADELPLIAGDAVQVGEAARPKRVVHNGH